MSVIIMGMEMPKSCLSCLFGEGICRCRVLDRPIDISCIKHERRLDCPLAEVPDGHGRLIDADALHQLFEEQWHYLQTLDWEENPKAEAKQDGVNWCINTMHDDAPTIIEAEDGE